MEGRRERSSEKKKRRKSTSSERHHKKSKKHHKKHHKQHTHNLTSQYGSKGLITAQHLYQKQAEFRAWLLAVKNISFEALTTAQVKEYFEIYVEDYNTATLPHEKYYDMDQWVKKSSMNDDTEVLQIDFSRGNNCKQIDYF